MLDDIRDFSDALTSGNTEMAVGIGKELPPTTKEIARDMWSTWKAMVAGSSMPACPF